MEYEINEDTLSQGQELKIVQRNEAVKRIFKNVPFNSFLMFLNISKA